MNVESIIRASLDDAQSVLHQFIHDPQTIKVMNQTTQMICEVFRDRGRIFTCGNGGSMCDAMHFAEEWAGRFRADRQPLPAMALSDPAHLTCV
ncbi:MAG: SIS domain-containing protein, partial [Candidatus Poribacteria bacterium]|nr:SIS domain-containing protein [Candidatus Poribacteria bacterium]